MVIPVKPHHFLPSRTALAGQAVQDVKGATKPGVDFISRRQEGSAAAALAVEAGCQIAAAKQVRQGLDQFLARELRRMPIDRLAEFRRLKNREAVVIFVNNAKDEKLKLRMSQIAASTIGWGAWIIAR
jgi:hypothetical protein